MGVYENRVQETHRFTTDENMNGCTINKVPYFEILLSRMNPYIKSIAKDAEKMLEHSIGARST